MSKGSLITASAMLVAGVLVYAGGTGNVPEMTSQSDGMGTASDGMWRARKDDRHYKSPNERVSEAFAELPATARLTPTAEAEKK